MRNGAPILRTGCQHLSASLYGVTPSPRNQGQNKVACDHCQFWLIKSKIKTKVRRYRKRRVIILLINCSLPRKFCENFKTVKLMAQQKWLNTRITYKNEEPSCMVVTTSQKNTRGIIPFTILTTTKSKTLSMPISKG